MIGVWSKSVRLLIPPCSISSFSFAGRPQPQLALSTNSHLCYIMPSEKSYFYLLHTPFYSPSCICLPPLAIIPPHSLFSESYFRSSLLFTPAPAPTEPSASSPSCSDSHRTDRGNYGSTIPSAVPPDQGSIRNPQRCRSFA